MDDESPFDPTAVGGLSRGQHARELSENFVFAGATQKLINSTLETLQKAHPHINYFIRNKRKGNKTEHVTGNTLER